MLPFLLLLAAIQVLAIPEYASTGRILLHWGPVTVTSQALVAGILLILRFWAMALGLSLFSFTTTTTELLHGIEHLLRPLQRFGLPAHELALVMNIAIRFVPILGNEAERLMKAQASRGADFAERSLNPLRRVRAMLPLLVPLFLMSLRRADQLVEAMEARCYLGGRSRTHLIHLHARAWDYVVLVLAFLNIVVAATYGRPALGEALIGLFSR
jgi:energy-coupling factor transport system permease protein